MTMTAAKGSRERRSVPRGQVDAARSAVKVCLHAVLLLMLCSPMAAYSAPPDLKTPTPVIYLADNLDEQDNLGFCIDTVGRGFSERLHAHSCKPRGGDVQFDYDRKRIVSATYAGKCATLQAPAAAGVSLGLLDCSEASAGQIFDYDVDAMEFRPGVDRGLCLVVGAESRTAGPFMSRSLELAPCASTDAARKQWRVKGGRS